MSTKLAIGQTMPAFSLPATGGQTIGNEDLIGRQTVIYFYPKDSTPGCTRESQGFRDLHDDFAAAGTRIIGCSRDGMRSHERFKERQALPFELIADEDEVLCTLFDVIRMKNMYGKQVRGIERSTFLFDHDGILRKEWRKVRVDGHCEAVLTAARALAAGEPLTE